MTISSIVRTSLVLSLAALALSGTAHAKKATADGSKTYPTIEMTNIAEFDSVFSKAKDIHTTIDNQTATLKTAHDNVNTVLGVAADAPLSDAMKAAVAAAAGKLSLQAGGVPHLKAADDASDTVKKDADAINGLVDAGVSTKDTVAKLIPEVGQLIDACKDFPAKVPSLVTDPMALVKATKLVANDVKAVTTTPDRLKALGDAATAVFNDVKAAFGG